MAFLDKKSVVFDRDEEGKLIPVDVVIETLKEKPTIKVLPVSRGRLKKLFQKAKDGSLSAEDEAEIIAEFCVEPKFTKEEVENSKEIRIQAIITTILSVSLGMTQEEIGKKGIEGVKGNEDFLPQK